MCGCGSYYGQYGYSRGDRMIPLFRKANSKFVKSYKEFIKAAKTNDPKISELYNKVSSAITALHKALCYTNSVVMIEYTTLFDEILLGLTEKAEKQELRKEHISLAEEMFKCYLKLLDLARSDPNQLPKEAEQKMRYFEAKASELGAFPSEGYLSKDIDVEELSLYLSLQESINS